MFASWTIGTLCTWFLTQMSFTVVGCTTFRLFPSLRSYAFSHNIVLPKLLRAVQKNFLPSIQMYDYILILWAVMLAYALTESVMTLVGSVMWTFLFSVGYTSVMRASINTLNLASFGTTSALGLTHCTTVKKSLSEKPSKFFFCGVLGMLESEDLKVKLHMHDYLRQLTESFNAVEDWAELMTFHKEGDLVMKAEKLSTSFNLKYMASWHEAYLIVSLLWRLGRISRPLVKAFIWILGCWSKDVRMCTAEVATEITLLIAFETVLSNFEVAEMGKGCSVANPIFLSNSDIVIVPVHRSNTNSSSGEKGSTYTAFDNRHINIFGGGKAFCPGRFFVGKMYMAQPKFANPDSIATDIVMQEPHNPVNYANFVTWSFVGLGIDVSLSYIYNIML